MSTQNFISTTPPWFFLAVADPSPFTNYLWRLKLETIQKGVVLQLRGAKMQTVTALFNEAGASLQFPYYFGENWNAFDECLSDLSWLPAEYYVFGILDAPQVLALEEDELRVFGRILERACAMWAAPVRDGQPWDRPAVPFHVVFQCGHGQEELTMARFRNAGIDLAPMTRHWSS